MPKLSLLLVCIAVIGCASRPDTAPIENATTVPGYLQSTKPQTAAAAPAPASQQPSATSMSALNDNGNSVKTLPAAPVASQGSKAAASAMVLTPVAGATSGWMVPTAGKTDGYKAGAKGIDIYGNEGQAIYAANDGHVVYSGNGLKGYGNLIIIKHDDTYLTAYAQNKINLVKEGANVKRGQRIAEMGLDDNGKAVLHFELRKNGKPVDPFSLIKSN